MIVGRLYCTTCAVYSGIILALRPVLVEGSEGSYLSHEQWDDLLDRF